ncbi:MAG: PEGA domain-containing protein [Methanoregula sp.]|jgi:hypothetical protein
MKRFTLIVCFCLLLIIAVPVSANVGEDSISTISPSGGATDNVVTVTITGQNFSTSQYPGSVRLEKSGKSDITSSSCSEWSSTQVKCKFNIPKNAATGMWDLVVVKGNNLGEIEKDDMFTVTDPMTLTSISPKSGRNDDDDVDFTIKGKNFEDNIASVYLLSDDDEEITADDFERESSTEITGTFDLEDEDEGTYDVCVEDDYGAVECDLEFEITSTASGSIAISSSPSGAAIYIDNIANGTTPNTVDDLLVGSYKIVLKKSGYEDWGKIVNVEEEEEAEVDAKLYAVATATPTTKSTPAPTTVPRTTVRTTVKSTIKIPTTWVDTPTTTAESPLDPAILIGAVGLVFLALRKH